MRIVKRFLENRGHSKLWVNRDSIVYRAHRSADNFPVVLKVLKGEYPPPEELARFKREYEMTHSLSDVDGKFAIRRYWKAR